MNILDIVKHYYNVVRGRFKIKADTRNSISIPKVRKYKKFAVSVDGTGNAITINDGFKSSYFKLKIRGDNNKVIIGSNFTNNGKCHIYITGSNNLIFIADNVKVVSQLTVYCHENGHDCTIRIGSNTSFYKTEIYDYDDGSSVEIGEDCMFAYDTTVYNTDGHSIFQDGKLINQAKGLTIGNHVWIGWGSTVLKNSCIPNGCIVGKSAVVARRFSTKNCAIAGSPARIVKENICWDRKTVNEAVKES